MQGGRADWLVEKAAELGAYALRPLVSERVHAAGGIRRVLLRSLDHLPCMLLPDGACNAQRSAWQ